MTTQQAQWRRDFEEWAKAKAPALQITESVEHPVARHFSEHSWLAAAQKYSPTPEEREYLEACYEHEALSRSGPFRIEDLINLGRRKWEAYQALHATRQPPRVDHLKEALAILDRTEAHFISDTTRAALRHHIEATMEASK